MTTEPLSATVDDGPGIAPSSAGSPEIVVLADSYPVISETFVAAEAHVLRELGFAVRIEATERGEGPLPGGMGDLPASYLREAPRPRQLSDLAWLVRRHPRAVAADVRARRRWRREETVEPLRRIAPLARRAAVGQTAHFHAHFASGAALTAMRLSRLLGRPYSVTAHAHDIYRKTRNLPEKLRRAAFSTSGCDYTVRDLQRIAGPGHADRVHKIVMGVAGEQFQRSEPYPGGRVVVAVGRLVRKKGFRYLLQAVGILRGSFPLDRVVFLGDGPLTRKLRILARRGGVSDQVEWLGAQPHSAVRELLERADLLVMPCVIAGSGNRDSMPVVVKEALAMEVPVVASDEVGLPEIVREPWGRLAPPRDAEALAEQIRQVLSRSREERIEMGRAGRAFVLEHCDLYRETAKLAELITAASGAVPTGAGIARTASGRS